MIIARPARLQRVDSVVAVIEEKAPAPSTTVVPATEAASSKRAKCHRVADEAASQAEAATVKAVAAKAAAANSAQIQELGQRCIEFLGNQITVRKMTLFSRLAVLDFLLG